MAAVKFLKSASGVLTQNAASDELSFAGLTLSAAATVGTTLGVTGAATVGSLNASSGGITFAGAVSGVSTLSMSGALSGATTGGFSQAVTAGSLVSVDLDTSGASALTIGTVHTNGITIGKSGITSTVAGDLTVTGNITVTGVETLVAGTTFGSQVNFGPLANADSGNTTKNSVLAQFQYSYWGPSGPAQSVSGFALRATPQSNASGVGDLSFLDAGATERARLVAGTSKLLVNAVDAISAGALAIGASTATSVTITPATTVSGALTMSTGGTVTSGQTLTVTGATIACSTGATISGTANFTGAITGTISTDITINTNKFTVAASTGNTVVAGTLSVGGSGTALSVTNNASVGGTLGVTGTSTLATVNAGAVTGSSLATSSNGAITANGSGNISTTSGNISTGSGKVYGVEMSASTALATPAIQASGWGNIVSSGSADLSIGTDSDKTRNIIIGSGAGTITLAGTVSGTISGSAASANTVVTSGFTADTAGVTAKDPLYVSANDKVLKADCTSLAKATVLGFASVTAASGVATGIETEGILTGVLSSATFGTPVYLSASGGFTTTAPSTSGQVILQVGIAKNATDMLIRIGQPIVIA